MRTRHQVRVRAGAAREAGDRKPGRCRACACPVSACVCSAVRVQMRCRQWEEVSTPAAVPAPPPFQRVVGEA